MTNNARKGFTLVELSIVLVIIGLLIGGILVAQSMIGTTRTQTTIRQIGQFDAAVANFQTKFNQLPGDTNLMGGVPGNNDGKIDASASKFKGEIGEFWSDLSASGLTNPTGGGTFTDASAGAAWSTATSPVSSVGTNGFYFAFGTAAGTNFYVITNPNSANDGATVITPAPALKPADALAIDAKLDDGNAMTGNVLGNAGATLAAAIAAPATDTCAASATGLYATGTQTVQCNLAIRIGVSTGTLD